MKQNAVPGPLLSVSRVAEHYRNYLGPLYVWMSGDLDAAFARADCELDALGLPALEAGIAVDLGAGFGLHSLPLARRGASVLAVDSYAPLLAELDSRKGTLDVRTIEADLRGFRAHLTAPADVIVCMGDTLTHLPDLASVAALFSEVRAALKPGGIFAATFRDYVTAPLQGGPRFVAVRSDDSRILTCFLEYAEEIVMVHDLWHQREAGGWRLRTGSYPKLRLAPDRVAALLSGLGFEVRQEMGTAGMVRIRAALGTDRAAASAPG